MTTVAAIRGIGVHHRFGVTTGITAAALDFVVIHCQRRSETERAVTGAALVRGIHVTRTFSCGLHTVVAAVTRRRGFNVIERIRRPLPGYMTRCAIVGGWGMTGALTHRRRAVMTIKTRERCYAVIHDRRDIETTRRVARFALRRYRNMAERFSARELAIVTTTALLRQSLEGCVNVTGFAAN